MTRVFAMFLLAGMIVLGLEQPLQAQNLQSPPRTALDDIFGFRLQNFTNVGAPGIYTGVPDLTLDDGRSTLRYVTWTPGDNAVTITYDANGEGQLSVALINGNGNNYFTTYTNIGGAVDYFKARPITDANGITIAIGIQDPGVSITLKNVTVDGVNLGDLSNDNAVRGWSVGNVSMNDGFTITATVTIAGPVSGTPGNCYVDVYGSVLPAGPTPTAYLASCPLATLPDLFGWRLRSFAASTAKELYAGVTDLGVATNRTEGDVVWGLGDNQLSLTYDKTTNALMATITNENGTYTLQYPGLSATVAPEVLTVSVSALDAGSTVALKSFVVDGAALGDLSVSGTTQKWTVRGIDFTDGMTITGVVNVSGAGISSQDNCSITFMTGMISSAAKFSTAECVNMLKPCTMQTVAATALPTFDASITVPKRLVVGTRTDGLPGSWLVMPDCAAEEMANGGYTLPEVQAFPSSRGWKYSVTTLSADGKWAAGCATMNNTDATDGYTAGYQYPVNAARNQTIRIPNGTVVGIKWLFIAGNGSVAMAVPESIGSADTRTATNGDVVAVGSSVPFCPNSITRTAFGDYMGLNGTQACVIEVVPGGDQQFFTLVNGVWANRMYNIKNIRPTNALYVKTIQPITYFGPQRNTTPCDWYVVGLATGVSASGEGGIWQVRHQSATNLIRYDYISLGTNEKLNDFGGKLERKDGWSFMVDESRPMSYNNVNQNTTVYAYAVNTMGNSKNPFSNGSEITAGTRVNVSYTLNVNLTVGDHCNAVYTASSIDCGNLTLTSKKGYIVRCNDGQPVFGSTPDIADEEVITGLRQGGEVVLAPNPTRGMTTLSVEGASPSAESVRIMDATGRTVSVAIQSNGASLLFDASLLAPGVYVVIVDVDGQPHTSAFVVR